MSQETATTAADTATDHRSRSGLTFEKPGPGTWELDDLHFDGPASRWMIEVFPPAMQEGFGQAADEYGGLLGEPSVEAVNGFLYISMRPAVGSPEASDPPPKLLFKLFTKLHPTVRRRVARMEETFETRRWREDLQRWDEEWKPEHIERNRALQSVDPGALDDAALADHLAACRDQLEQSIVLHHRMDLCPMFPLGDFLVHVEEWTDRSAREVLGLFDDASPISAGAVDELEACAVAIDDDPDARELLFSGAPAGEVVERLGDRPGEVGAAVEAWLDVVGYRIVGYDVAEFYALEQPSVLVRTLRAAVEDGADTHPGKGSEQEVASIRREVPPPHREEFDELYEEARLTYRIRDERSLHDLWTAGLTRRAILEAGRRLTDRGALHEPDHAVDLAPDELLAGLRHGTAPPADEVAARVEHRRTHDNQDAPDRLGPAQPPSPPLEWLPDPAERGMRALEAMMENVLETGDVESGSDAVRGLAACPGTAEGTVRVVSGPDDFSRIQEGDVLVTEATSPAFNVVLPLIDAVVTDTGGVLSHAAVVAREYGIPAVVGCEDATERLADGTRVTVDGQEGTVRIQGRPGDTEVSDE